MNSSLKIFHVILPVLLIISCRPPPQKASAPNVVAFVNGQTIFEDQLKHRLALEKAKYDDKTFSDQDLFEPLKKELLDQMIQNKVIADWGKKRNILLTNDELFLGIKSIKKGYTDKAFETFLSEKGVPFSEWRLMTEEKLLVKKIIDQEVNSKAEVSPKELSAYYKAHLNDFKTGESVRARHIVTDTEAKAKNILSLIEKGENFTKVAILHSLSPDRANGGDLGYFTRGTHPEIFDETCFKLGIGDLSPIVKSPYGYHIFKITDKKPAHTKTLEEASPDIYSILVKNKMTSAFDSWLDSVLKESQIQVIDENVRKIKNL
ncbi:MAG: hypothetical protein ACD_73C00144G0002 [uncultured bacterium]|nr:MAG: hypothetical protein ACD_73C00144G0002 [uncultured bacterium]